MREDANRSLLENSGLVSKSMVIYRHVSSSEFCNLDITGRLVVYLFFRFLAAYDCRSNILDDGLTFEALTELAYRARWMEMIGEAEGEEVFSFIISLRDDLCSNRMDPPEPSRTFCSSPGMGPDDLEISDIFSYIWQRRISNHFNADGVKLVEKVLDVSDGDLVLIESDTLPGPFMAFGKEKNPEIIMVVRNDLDRVLGKMLLFMLLPRDKWKSRKVVKQLPEEIRQRPNKIISFIAMGSIVRGGRGSADGFDSAMASIAPMIERGAMAVFPSTASFLSFDHGSARRCRSKLFDLGSPLSVLSFGKGRGNFIVIDGLRSDRDSVLLVDLSDAYDFDSSEIASCITGGGNVPERLKSRIITVSRDEVKANGFMLYPSFYRDMDVKEKRGIDEIDSRLSVKYKEMKNLMEILSE